jgi:hypothetical protein
LFAKASPTERRKKKKRGVRKPEKKFVFSSIERDINPNPGVIDKKSKFAAQANNQSEGDGSSYHSSQDGNNASENIDKLQVQFGVQMLSASNP